jgi:hypothetical protein
MGILAHMSPGAIAQVTRTSYRTVNRILRLSRLAGAVVCKPLESRRLRLLTAADVSMSNQSSSYDFNPIGEGFLAILKAWIRRNRGYARGELMGEPTCDPYQLLWDAVFALVTPEKARGWFAHSRYLS